MSKSFKRPNFDDSILMPQWVQFNGQHSSDHPLFVYSALHADLGIITWSQAAQAIENAAHLVWAHLTSKSQNAPQPHVVGILANIDSITYHTLLWGIVRTGGTAFPISDRNSPIAVAQLLKKTGTQTIFVSSDKRTQQLASSALDHPGLHEVTVHTAPAFDELYSSEKGGKCTNSIPDYPKTLIDSPGVILHSSGTTSSPKPVYMSHRIILQWSKNAYIASKDMSRHRMAAHALPVYHGMGYFVFLWAALTGMSLAVFPPHDLPVNPSPQYVLDAAASCRSTIMLSVPHFIELWIRDTENVEKLKQFDAIVFGGGPLNKEIGHSLSQGGVSLVPVYGMCEVGPVTRFTFDRSCGKEWDWINMLPECDPRYIAQEDQLGVFELVYVDCPTHSPACFNFEIEGRRAFATNDLVTRHPSDPMKFRFFGRKDDQIILRTGEKTNPAPMEDVLCRDPLIHFAVIFGRGKSHNGVLLQPVKGHEIDPSDSSALARYRHSVWQSVERANQSAPVHSRIFKEMILVTHPSKPMQLSAKLAPRRASVLESYKEEIESAYTAPEPLAQFDITPFEWTPLQVFSIVRNTVHTVMNKEEPVHDDDDIFQQGADSLQATIIRNALLHVANKKSMKYTELLSDNFVYAHPSITRLGKQLLNIVHTDAEVDSDGDKAEIHKMMKLISENSSQFPVHRPSMDRRSSLGDIVLITGTTGSLGSQLLSHVASLPNVTHVYALNRPSDKGGLPLRERQTEAFIRQGLHTEIINSSKLTLIECDTSTKSLKIDPTLFNEIRHSITLIIHCGWRVNFKLALESFEPMIRSVRTLIDLSLQSPKAIPPRIIFTGSVSVYRNWRTLERPREAAIDDPRLVLWNGYSESKWVGERILEEAAKYTPLRPIIVRIGQITSNSNGAWNSRDWVPAIVRSGQALGALPSRDDSIAWISLDVAAQVIFDFRTSSSQYLHLAHPDPVPWTTVFHVFSSMLNIPLVPWDEWLTRLQADKSGPEGSPAVQLLDLFQNAPSVDVEHREAIGSPLLDLNEALKASTTLANAWLPRISGEDAERWVKYWTRIGFLKGSEGVKCE